MFSVRHGFGGRERSLWVLGGRALLEVRSDRGRGVRLPVELGGHEDGEELFGEVARAS